MGIAALTIVGRSTSVTVTIILIEELQAIVILYGSKCLYKDSMIINVAKWVLDIHRTSIQSKSELFHCPSMWCQIFLRQGL